MRTKARRDKVESQLERYLQDIGFVTARISSAGIPDLIAFHPSYGLWFLECKSKGGKLTPAQIAFFEKFAGANVIVARDIDQVLAEIGVTK